MKPFQKLSSNFSQCECTLRRNCFLRQIRGPPWEWAVVVQIEADLSRLVLRSSNGRFLGWQGLCHWHRYDFWISKLSLFLKRKCFGFVACSKICPQNEGRWKKNSRRPNFRKSSESQSFNIWARTTFLLLVFSEVFKLNFFIFCLKLFKKLIIHNVCLLLVFVCTW